MGKKQIRAVMLCSNGLSSKIIYNGIQDSVCIKRVIIEEGLSKYQLFKKRVKRYGIGFAISQVFFVFYLSIINRISSKRVRYLLTKLRLGHSAIPKQIIDNVASINNQEVIQILKDVKPDVVVVNGTRIISEKVLKSIDVPFLNTHMGITPRYRGVHGGYWALANNDSANCGVTVHLVDKGIDTGGVLYQDIINPEKNDNFCTYPILQISKGLFLMKKALMDVQNKTISVQKGVFPSQLFTHPTLLQYFKNYFFNKVK